MKRLYASILCVSLMILSCTFSTPNQNPPTSLPISDTSTPISDTPTPDLPTATPPPDPMSIPWDDRSIFADGLVPSERHILGELEGASVYHLEFTIQESLYEIYGTEEVRYTNTEDVDLTEVQFRLFPNILGGEMNITNLTIDGQSITPSYDLNSSLMIVPLFESLKPGQSIVLKMDYDVSVPQILELNYGVQAYAENVLALAHAYPMIAVYDDEGWNAEIPPQSGDVTYADASFYIVRVHAPKGLTLATTGREMSHDEDGQDQVVTVANGPARDFYLAASYDYKITSKTHGDVTIRSFAPTGNNAGVNLALDVASKAIDVFGNHYAPYPYTELDIVYTPTLALGIEYPGAIAITGWIYDIDEDERARGYMEGTVAHEVGHQWFYGLVGDDQLDDPWLDESLAQFATYQYFSDQYGTAGEEIWRATLEWRWVSVNRAEIPIGLPVASYSGAEYSAIVYGRGPLFFIALHDQMGDESFENFIRNYTENYSWGIATPQGLQSIAEESCGCDLQSIFDKWVYP